MVAVHFPGDPIFVPAALAWFDAVFAPAARVGQAVQASDLHVVGDYQLKMALHSWIGSRSRPSPRS